MCAWSFGIYRDLYFNAYADYMRKDLNRIEHNFANSVNFRLCHGGIGTILLSIEAVDWKGGMVVHS